MVTRGWYEFNGHSLFNKLHPCEVPLISVAIDLSILLWCATIRIIVLRINWKIKVSPVEKAIIIMDEHGLPIVGAGVDYTKVILSLLFKGCRYSGPHKRTEN